MGCYKTSCMLLRNCLSHRCILSVTRNLKVIEFLSLQVRMRWLSWDLETNMSTSLALSFLRGRYQLNAPLDLSISKSSSHLLVESIFKLFPFSWHRPLGTSFKGKYGRVDYWVKAFLDRPSQPTQETKKNFEVVDLVDINTPDLMVRFILRFYSLGSQGW